MKRLLIKSWNLKLQPGWLLAILMLGYSLPVLSQQERRIGIGTSRPGARLDVTGKIKADTVGRPAGDFYIQAGQDVRLLTGSTGAVTPGTDGGSSLGTPMLNWSALYAQKTQADSLKMVLNAEAGKVLTSDAAGNASWNTVTTIDLDSAYYPPQLAWLLDEKTGAIVNKDETLTLSYDSTWFVQVKYVEPPCSTGKVEADFFYTHNLYFDANANRWKITQTNNGTSSCGDTRLYFGLALFKIRR